MGRQEKNVEEAASLMVERFGFKALQQVDQRILELQEHGEEDAVSLWREIRGVVAMLLNKNETGRMH